MISISLLIKVMLLMHPHFSLKIFLLNYNGDAYNSVCKEHVLYLKREIVHCLQVVILLRGDEYITECAKECQERSIQRTYSEELLDAEEYNSTRYLSDLNRHKQVAFSS